MDVGISVIPVRPQSKFPDAQALTASGNLNLQRQPSWQVFIRRMATQDEVNTWFASDSGSLGIVAGYGQLLILDFDRLESYDHWFDKYAYYAKRTSIQKTRNGFHVLFRWKNVWTMRYYVNNAFQLLNTGGINAGELKGGSDYVVAWPSVHPDGGQYQWLPGQAPWETEIVRIDSLEEIGIEPVKKIPESYTAFVLKLFAHPGGNIPILLNWIKNKYTKPRRKPR